MTSADKMSEATNRSTGEPAAVLDVRDLVAGYPVKRTMLQALTRKRRERVQAVDSVSLTVNSGEILALVGESGSGKTTTALSVLRMVDADAGVIRFLGSDIARQAHRAMRPLRRQMQIIYQDPYESLDPRLTVRDAVMEPLAVHGEPRHTREERVRDALTRAELTPPEFFLRRYPHELSGGQRQRVAIAAALVLDPALLVADEPVSMLDVSVRAGVLGVFSHLKASGLGILMITHDLSTAAHYADRICVMYLGRIVEQGSAHEIIHNPRHPYTQALISVVPNRNPDARSQPRVLKGEAPDPQNVPSGCRFHPRCPLAQAIPCQVEDPRLLPTTKAGHGHDAACHFA